MHQCKVNKKHIDEDTVEKKSIPSKCLFTCTCKHILVYCPGNNKQYTLYILNKTFQITTI